MCQNHDALVEIGSFFPFVAACGFPSQLNLLIMSDIIHALSLLFHHVYRSILSDCERQ